MPRLPGRRRGRRLAARRAGEARHHGTLRADGGGSDLSPLAFRASGDDGKDGGAGGAGGGNGGDGGDGAVSFASPAAGDGAAAQDSDAGGGGGGGGLGAVVVSGLGAGCSALPAVPHVDCR